MKTRPKKGVLMCLFLASLLMGPGLIQAQKQKIKVTTEGASIRVKPDEGSEIIAAAKIGQVFEVEAKSEDWFEIRLKTELGVSVIGYIHSKYVEIEGPAAQEATPKKAEPAEPPIWLSLRLGGLYASMTGYNYDFSMTYYGEPLTISDSVANGGGAGVNFELGVMFLRFLEVTGGVSYYSKSMAGTYSFGLPNTLIYNDIAFDEASKEVNRKITILDFGINIHPLEQGTIRPYFGFGGSYVMAKMDLLKDMTYKETIYSNYTHKIEITEVKLVEKSLNKFGFHVRGGLELRLGGTAFLFIEGKYLTGKTEVPHPLTSGISGHENEKLTIDLSGVSGILGIKLFL
jgi:hypothetical protein